MRKKMRILLQVASKAPLLSLQLMQAKGDRFGGCQDNVEAMVENISINKLQSIGRRQKSF